MSFLPSLGGGGGPLGTALVRIGADARGIRSEVRRAMQTVKEEVTAGAQGVERTSSRWSSAFHVIGMAAKAGMLGVVAAVGAGIGAAIQFESSWAGVLKTVEGTPEELEELRQSFRDLAKEIPVSVNELAKIGETAGAMGIAKEGMLEFTKTVALLGQTTNVTTDAASTALGQLSNVLHLTTDDYGRFAATLVDLGNKGASTESQILEMASRAGSAAGLMNISAKDVLAYSSAVASLGIEVEAGGTSLQSFFLKTNKIVGQGSGLVDVAQKAGTTVGALTTAVNAGGKDLEKAATATGLTTKKLKELVAAGSQLDILANTAGMTGEEFVRAFEKDAAGALAVFLQGLGKLKGSGQQGILTDLKMSDVRITRTLLGLANGAGLLEKNLDNATAAWEANTAATEEAEKRFQTTGSQMGLIKNVIQDYLITLGEQALPVFRAFLGFLQDGLPRAVTFFVGLWKATLEPAVNNLLGAFGRLGESVLGLFSSGDKATSWSGVAKSAFNGLASGVAAVANGLSTIVDAVSWLLKNPLGQWVARLLLAAAAFKVITSGTAAVISGLRGTSATLARRVGLGGLVGPAVAAQGDPALSKSAADLSRSGTNLDHAAVSLERAARAGMVGPAGSVAEGAADLEGRRLITASSIRARGAPGEINMLGAPGMAIRRDGQMADIERAAYAQSSAAAKAYMRGLAQPVGDRGRDAFNRDAYNSGVNLIKNKAADIGNGVKAGAGMLKGAASGLLGLAGRAFWPLMVATIATEVLKAPIGNFISENTQFKRAGEKIKRDFVGGLIDLVQAWSIGSDLFVALPRTAFGKGSIDTKRLPGLQLSDEEIASLQGGGIGALKTQDAIAPRVREELKKKATESVMEWYGRVRQNLVDAGQSVDALDALAKAGTTTRSGYMGRSSTYTMTPQQIQALQVAVEGEIGAFGYRAITQTKEEIRNAVIAAVQGITGGQIPIGQLLHLPQETYDKLGTLLLQQASLDPKVFTLTLSRLIGEKAPGPTPLPGTDPETRRGLIDTSPAYVKTKSELDESARRLEGILKTLDSGRQAALDAYSAERDEEGNLAHTEAEVDKYRRMLLEAQEKDRQTNLSALGFLQEATKGLETLTGSKAHQAAQVKAREGVLTDINKRLGLTGEAALEWTDLINWQTALSESTGETARLELAKAVKEWSVYAAREGSKEGVTTFAKAWADDIEQAEWDDTAAALRRKLNGLIPGKANDVSKGKFNAWLEDAQSGDFTPEQLRKKLNKLIPGKADDLSKAEFAKWFADVVTFEVVEGGPAMEALRKRINDLIPGKADDISKAKFAAWLAGITGEAAATDPFPGKTADDFTGKVVSSVFPGKVADDHIATGSSWMDNLVSNAAKEGPSAETESALKRAGGGIVDQIAAGILQPSSVSKLGAAVDTVLKLGVGDHVPSSPVKAGPLKHPFLHKAGANIMAQLQGGMASRALALPSGNFSPSLGGARATMGASPGRKVDIHADKLQVFTEADERSMTSRFEFLTQEGR